jgi:hypothetical protein
MDAHLSDRAGCERILLKLLCHLSHSTLPGYDVVPVSVGLVRGEPNRLEFVWGSLYLLPFAKLLRTGELIARRI